MNRPLALVIDDEPDLCELLALTLDRMQIDTQICGDITTAKTRLQATKFDLCLTDMRLPDGDGLELVEWMQVNGIGIPVAVITAHGNVETAVRALKLGAFDFISKPLDLTALRKLIGSALKLQNTHEEVSGKVSLLGESSSMTDLLTLIDKVARSRAPVHITGESGTGKELVARMIHEKSAQAEGPFVPVNCGAIPSELMESEFFGHRKGAFTGAVDDHKGLFQSAEGGSLFMDEIADLPLAMQVKLLRVIQEKSVRPVGALEEIPVDVRILSATHKDLRGLVSSGQFREDLFYRIDVIELKVPPLRERGEDIDILTDFMLDKMARELGVAVPQLTSDARQKLSTYSYPGNVRELENILERAVALSGDEPIAAGDIQIRDSMGAANSEAALVTPEAGEPDVTGNVLGHQLETVERTAIINALEETRHNKTAAARNLGLTLRALRYRMQKLGIE
ncbi:MAG: sigma-54 dependent transcriptional regulator [Gammaproteobacteria bacterium]|nr:sigma-54-dependent Fis family transcriptional regulator [Chromatiales bacterium]MDP6675425.1 sigma-54 dependent transcriptional regulator [Gammaproteobacteria bacterium]